MNVNITNWNHYFYQHQNRKSYISLLYSGESIKPVYQVVVLENEHQEVFVKAFQALSQACAYLNSHYFHWQLTSSKEESSSEGCGTCQAH